MTEFEKLIKKLDDLTKSANTSCSEFTNTLIALGFQIENCGSAGHKIAKHSDVSLKLNILTIIVVIIKVKPLNVSISRSYTNLLGSENKQSRST